MQTIQSEEESFQRTLQEKNRSTPPNDSSRHTPTENNRSTPAETSSSTVNRPDSTTAPARTSRLSMFGRSRLPLAKPSPAASAKQSPASATKPGTSEISFPRATTPTRDPPAPQSHTPVSPPRAVSPSTSPIQQPRLSPQSPVQHARRLSAPVSPGRVGGVIAPMTPSRIPRVSMHASHPSWDRMDDVTKSPTPKTPARSQSSLGHSARGTPSSVRSSSSLSKHGTPPETDVDRERAWGRTLPKLTHANLRMRHDSMESSLSGSVYGGLSPGRPGSVVSPGRPGSVTGRPTTPSGRSFMGYPLRAGSEVSSSQGSAGSDEDAEARRERKMSTASLSRSGAEIRGPGSRMMSGSPSASRLASPTAASLARSGGAVARSPSGSLTRSSSLKSPAKATGAPVMRHSASFAGSSVSGGSRRLVNQKSAEYDKEVEHLRERDWGRPVHSRAPGLSSISPRPPRVGRGRVVSGGSVGSVVSESPESPIARTRVGGGEGAKVRPHTIHFGSLDESVREVVERGPLGGGEELLEDGGEEGYFGAQEQSHDSAQSPPSPSRSIPLPPSPPAVHVTAPAEA
ncbi:hypothetical protein FRC07_013566, partial [Ceratobasidium sp. 392]